jgi:hypothetical protein
MWPNVAAKNFWLLLPCGPDAGLPNKSAGFRLQKRETMRGHRQMFPRPLHPVRLCSLKAALPRLGGSADAPAAGWGCDWRLMADEWIGRVGDVMSNCCQAVQAASRKGRVGARECGAEWTGATALSLRHRCQRGNCRNSVLKRWLPAFVFTLVTLSRPNS